MGLRARSAGNARAAFLMPADKSHAIDAETKREFALYKEKISKEKE